MAKFKISDEIKNAIWLCLWKWAKSRRNETKRRLNYLSWKAHPPKQLKSPLTGFWLCMNGTTSPFARGIHLTSELWAVKPKCFTPPLHCLTTGQLLLHNINIVVSCSLSLNFLRNISNPQTKTCEFVIKLRVQSWTVGKLAKLGGEEIVIATILLSPINKVFPWQDTSPQYQ